MEVTYKGTANAAVMEPLLKLAALPGDLILAANNCGGFSGAPGANGSLTLTPEDPTVLLTWYDANGAVLLNHRLDIWGDEHSPSYWWPISDISYGESIAPDGSSIDLAETIRRAREFLDRVRFVEDEESVVPRGSRAAAAINYMRLRSGVTDEWTVALAAPFELLLDDLSSGGGDGLLIAFGELPPGLDEIGETALVEPEAVTEWSWRVRPAMAVFDEPCGDSSDDAEAGRAALQLLGFDSSQIDRLDALAAQVAEAYA